jgi:hypothetical protein
LFLIPQEEPLYTFKSYKPASVSPGTINLIFAILRFTILILFIGGVYFIDSKQRLSIGLFIATALPLLMGFIIEKISVRTFVQNGMITFSDNDIQISNGATEDICIDDITSVKLKYDRSSSSRFLSMSQSKDLPAKTFMLEFTAGQKNFTLYIDGLSEDHDVSLPLMVFKLKKRVERNV